jgi:hypothetical protein
VVIDQATGVGISLLAGPEMIDAITGAGFLLAEEP